MAVHYDGKTHRIKIGTNSWDKKDTMFVLRRHGNYLFEAEARYGKGVLAKHICVKASRFRKILVFDCHGEWEKSVTQPNKDALKDGGQPDWMVGVRVFRNFTFNLLTFTNESDYASMGFEGSMASIVCDIINWSAEKHGGDVGIVSEMMSNLPLKEKAYIGFNKKWGTKLIASLNYAQKISINTWWTVIREYFWKGPGDPRQVYNFGDEFKKTDHMIIDLSGGGSEAAPWISKAYAGKILEQLRGVWIQTNPLIVFEEAKIFFPAWEGSIPLSSNTQVHEMLTMGPKCGVSVIFIVQKKNQVFPPILDNIHAKIIGIVQESHGDVYDIPLMYDQDHNIREFIYTDDKKTSPTTKWDRDWIKFRPMVPCMAFRSERW